MLIKYRVTGGSLCFGFTGAISEAYYSLKQLLHIWRLVSDHGKFFGLGGLGFGREDLPLDPLESV